MPVWMRRTLIALGVLIGIAIAAAAWLVASFDPNRYKGLLIDWMRENKGRTLAIDGPIGLSVFPRIEVSLRDVKLSEQRTKAEFASLQEATLAVQVMPLLRQQLAVDRVAARGVRVAYARDAKGRRNIDDLLEPAPGAPRDAASAPASAQALRFDVSGIELEDVQATVKDEMLGLDGRFVVKRLATGRLADGAQSPISFVGQAVLAKPLVNAEIELDGLLKLALPAGAPAGASVDDLKLALRGAAFGFQKLDLKLAGALGYDGARSALDARLLQLAFAGQREGLALSDGKLKLDALAYDPAKRALRIDTLDLQLAARSGANAIEATLGWPKLSVAGDSLEGSALKGTVNVKGTGAEPLAMKLRFDSQPPRGSFERIRVPGLRLSIDGSAAQRTVRGEARTDVTLAPTPLAVALDALSLKLAFADPSLPPMNLTLGGQARAGAKDASWAFDGAINEQKLNTTGKADLSKDVPRIDAQARFAALDLTRFVKPTNAPAAAGRPAPGGAGANGKPAAASADTPVDLSGLKAIDGAFTLRAGTLVYPPYRVADAALDATLDRGRLEVSQLSGRSWGGKFVAQATAQAAADTAAQRVAMKLDATDVDIAALLRDVAQFERLEGKGRVTMDVNTRGAGTSQFKQRLGGKAAIELRDGALRGINLAKVMRQWKSAVSLNKDAVQASSAEEKTDFSEITASFDIADGVARNKDLSAKSPFLRVGGEGQVDIGRGRVDYLVKAAVANTSEGQGGADLAALKGVTLPVQLSGPLEAVDYKVQWSAVATQLLTGRAKEALNEKTRGAVGELLKGLGGAKPAAGASAPQGAASSPKQQLKKGLEGLFGR